MKKVTAPKARGVRDGNEAVIPAREIVPGDIVLLEAGDRVPADARLIEVVDLKADEAVLTGESTDVTKNLSIIKKETPVADRKNSVFMATHLTYGRGKALVTSTGMKTEFGKIAEMVQAAPQEKTPLEKRVGSVGKWIGILAVIIAISVGVIGIIVQHRDPLDMLLWAIS